MGTAHQTDELAEALARDGVTKYLPGTICVSFHSGTPSEEIREIVSALECRLQHGFEEPVDYAVIIVPEGRDEEMVEAFQAAPQVAAATLNTLDGSVP